MQASMNEQHLVASQLISSGSSTVIRSHLDSALGSVENFARYVNLSTKVRIIMPLCAISLALLLKQFYSLLTFLGWCFQWRSAILLSYGFYDLVNASLMSLPDKFCNVLSKATSSMNFSGFLSSFFSFMLGKLNLIMSIIPIVNIITAVTFTLAETFNTISQYRLNRLNYGRLTRLHHDTGDMGISRDLKHDSLKFQHDILENNLLCNAGKIISTFAWMVLPIFVTTPVGHMTLLAGALLYFAFFAIQHLNNIRIARNFKLAHYNELYTVNSAKFNGFFSPRSTIELSSSVKTRGDKKTKSFMQESSTRELLAKRLEHSV